MFPSAASYKTKKFDLYITQLTLLNVWLKGPQIPYLEHHIGPLF